MYGCDHCNKQFNTNTELYRHKHSTHKSPTLVLVNHRDNIGHSSKDTPNIEGLGDQVAMIAGRKRKAKRHAIEPGKRKRVDNGGDDIVVESDDLSESDNDSHDFNPSQPKIKILNSPPTKIPRKRKAVDVGDIIPRKKKKFNRKNNPQNKTSIASNIIVDSDQLSDVSDHVEENEQNPPQTKIKITNKRKRFIDDYPHPLEKKRKIDIDSNSISSDESISDDYPKTLRSRNYKHLYKRCIYKFGKLERRYNELNENLKIEESKCNDKINQLEEHYKNRLINLDNESGRLNVEHERKMKDLVDTYEKEINDIKLEYEQRTKMLNDLIKDLESGQNENFNTLSKAIFNCSSIEEISKVQYLLETGRYDEVINKHLRTVQNLFLGLSMNVIPICNSQRSIITDKQRNIIKTVQGATPSTAKRELKGNINDFTNLFTIIGDSLDLVRRTYNRYGSKDEAP